jgi:predicted SnoaL-like aldol condensation-catalyzing enzyme
LLILIRCTYLKPPLTIHFFLTPKIKNMCRIALPFAFVALLLSSCNGDKKAGSSDSSSLKEKNLSSSHIVNKAFETGDTGMIDSAVASDFVDHTDKGDMNRDSLKAMIKMVHATNKDMKMDMIKEIADDEYVFSLMHFTGTSDGSMMPAGPYDMKGMEVVKFKDGKASEHWEYMEPAEMMKMMAKMPDAEMGKNTTEDRATKKK